MFALLYLNWVHPPLPQMSSPVALLSLHHQRKYPACLVLTAEHYCCPSCCIPRRWYQPLPLPDPPSLLSAVSVPSPHSPLFRPPSTQPYYLSHARTNSLTSRCSPPLLLHRTRPQHWQNLCRSKKSALRLPPSRHRSAPRPPGSLICFFAHYCSLPLLSILTRPTL